MATNAKMRNMDILLDKPEAEQHLQLALGDQATFKAHQWEAIDSLVNKSLKLLLVQKTGWGKSVVYFLTTKILRAQHYGPTLVVSPLLSLIRNQLSLGDSFGLTVRNIDSTNFGQWDDIVAEITSNAVDVLFVTPERFANEQFNNRVLSVIAERLGLLVVDEAHCISDWGHAFRPDYRRLKNTVEMIPEATPVLCTTATANDRVVDDIQSILGNFSVLRGPLIRETLQLQHIRLPDMFARLAWMAENLDSLPGTGIIYSLTVRDANHIAEWLRSKGIDALAYHSEIDPAQRINLENRLMENDFKVVVATSALGMGYDKPDIGYIIHYQPPPSVVTYYQQIGRAGRGIDKAVCVLLSGQGDDVVPTYFMDAEFPKKPWVIDTVNVLDQFEGLTSMGIERELNLRRSQINQVLKVLSVDSPAPIIKEGTLWKRTPASFTFNQQRFDRVSQQRKDEWDEVSEYLSGDECLMKFLANSLDDPQSHTCGKCSNCTDSEQLDERFSQEVAEQALQHLLHWYVPIEPRKQQPFRHGNLTTQQQAKPGWALCRWKDEGWGKMVAEDFEIGKIRPELVSAMSEMVSNKWPEQPFRWVTCIPSRSLPDHVSDLAFRVASELGLDFKPAIIRARENQRQLSQQNTYHQCANLKDTYRIGGELIPHPVLLIDDSIRSRWTMTVASLLLLESGCREVYPAALVNTGHV